MGTTTKGSDTAMPPNTQLPNTTGFVSMRRHMPANRLLRLGMNRSIVDYNADEGINKFLWRLAALGVRVSAVASIAMSFTSRGDTIVH